MSDDKTPARRGQVPITENSLALAAQAVALATAATQLENAGALIRGAAVQCGEASRLMDDHGAVDRSSLLRELEEQLGVLADGIHETRRRVRACRLALEATKP